jgi:type VI secretion system secreted protein VgrG
MPLNQSKRLIRMTKGPLGPDEVVVTSFSGNEAISRPFDFVLEFISTKLDLKPKDVIGKDLTIELDRRDLEAQPIAPRYFHGYINRFAAGEVVFKEPGEHKYRRYQAGMVPWLWFLSKTARCFLFFPEKKEKSIFEVIEAVFNRAKSDLHVDPASDFKGIADLKNRKVEHCVQYRETDFNFVSRMMEQYGVFYYFKFEDGKHTLVLDMKKNYPACEEAEVMFPPVSGPQPAGDHITSWQHDYQFVSGKWTHTDYNFETPSASLKASVPKLPSVDLPQGEKYEIYDYPGEYAVQPDGVTSARVRQEEEEVQHDAVDGGSTCRTFTAGYTFKLTAHPDEDSVSEHDKSYLLTSVTHSASQSTDDTSESAGASYHNSFTCIADSIQYRPARITPRPIISGVQTAVVVGPKGEEIYTDEYGRVKVQFHWDRVGSKDENSSCWIRVSSPWAGKTWGEISIPRIGQEVIVEFLEGDPDRPIITGRVYNDEQMPPYALPANKTQSGKKSRSSKGGSPDNFNEIRFEDLKGSELFSVQAEKDMKLLVKNNRSETVKVNRTESIGGNHSESIGGNHSTTVGGDKSTEVTGFQTVTVKKAKNELVYFASSEEVGLARNLTVGAAYTIEVVGAMNTAVGAAMLTEVALHHYETVGRDRSLNVGKKLTIDATDEIEMKSGPTSLVMKKGGDIELKTGAASLKMKQDGKIEISGIDVTVKSSAGTVNIDAGGIISIKGPMVKINT